MIKLMSGDLQEGIYFSRKPQIGNSFCIIFLRASGDTNAIEIGHLLTQLWTNFNRLKNGIVNNLDFNPKRRSTGNLSVLIGYSPKIFDLNEVKKSAPVGFSENSSLNQPDPRGGGAILNGTQMYYSDDLIENHVLRDHIMIQIISDSEFHTNRAFVEAWKELNRLNHLTRPRRPLRITRFYSGFHRSDMRNWQGFLDGVSNIVSQHRKEAMAISSRNLKVQDQWMTNGTYMAFLRIFFDLESWERIDTEQQELIIGRDKESGCPLIGIDPKGRPVKDPRCPIPGTFEVIERGNEYFRELHPIGRHLLPPGISDAILQKSHIAISGPKNNSSYLSRIFRQSFEFLEFSDSNPGLKVGLNFISFQNNPENFIRSLSYKPSNIKFTTSIERNLPRLENFLSVYAGGIFIVPPYKRGEPFPGSAIFFTPADYNMKNQ